jgi:large subunit ribosomal protein L1
MDRKTIENTLKKLKENSPKRNFKQSIDLIINLKGLDLKKAEHQVNMFVTLSHDIGKKISICAFVGPEMESKAKEFCNEVILQDQFEKFKGKSEIKKLANRHDFFISQASIMPKVATVFGRFLGPRGKMPNPKIGGILSPNANIGPLYEKLKRTVNLTTKNEPTVKCVVGKEDAADNEIIDNIMTVFNSVVHKLPNENQNVKNVMLKLTMGPAFTIGGNTEEKGGKKKGKKNTKKSEEIKEEKPREVKEEGKKEESKQDVKKEEPNSKN